MMGDNLDSNTYDMRLKVICGKPRCSGSDEIMIERGRCHSDGGV